ncbi:efflux RND transporter periplasmic adaptor subunit [Pseudogemmobacter humi]|uniref:Multidrug resistance protein MdtA n=1 Tax=Pseudogemmobacter humi TaxID=2483812 RepID=A0A3P5XD52_9RHOB|nr:efflux RND transporter periplasmic adaptor subunit [Pseudogemmobacter humi]VDC26397.1 Multidrug resistance protein MdtA precursor [Pseudogemmobacter humi]
MRLSLLTALFPALFAAAPMLADPLTVAPVTIAEMKPVFGTVEARDTIPARARIGGTLTELLISEGDRVEAGDRLAVVRDDKIAFQISAYDARLQALASQLTEAGAELARGESLTERGVASAQRLDQLRTAVEVIRGQIAATEAERAIAVQQQAEGEVLAPGPGLVLSVPVTAGAVIMPGETVAVVGGGGFFLRLSVPERHAPALAEGAQIRIVAAGRESEGRLAKVYPQIAGGRVQADVEVADLPDAFVGARVAVLLPVGERQALLVPAAAVITRAGVDFVTMADGTQRAVVTAPAPGEDGMAEILTGLAAGERIEVP